MGFTELSEPARADPHAELPEVMCAHCALPVAPGDIVPGAAEQFCCAGCRTVYAILRTHGLTRYYDLPERRATPVRSSGRGFEEFDHTTFHDLYVRPLRGGLCRVELYLEGVRCASCVWLVERTPLVLDGIVHAELQLRRSLASVTWDPSMTSLSNIARTLDGLGYAPHPYRGVERDAIRKREDRSMLSKIGVAGALAANVMLAALALYSGWFGGMEHEWARFFRWISLIVATPALFGPGRVFFKGAWSALRARTLHMDVPIALALAAGYARGAFNTVTDHGPIYFDGLVTLILLLLVGRYLQLRGQRAANDAAELLYSLTPMTARVVEQDGTTREMPTDAVLPGMLLEVRAGETFPADGVVERGSSRVDMSLLTGEARPVSADVGGRVYAGTVNHTAPLWVRIAHAGEESRVARIMRQVEASTSQRAPVVLLANRLAGWFVGGVITLAALTAAIWYFRSPALAVDNAISMLIVTCPCALALSTPLAVAVAIGRAARCGIYVKGGDALQTLASPAQLFLDKTGTVTQARMEIIRWSGPDWVRPLVLGLEGESSHPIAEAFRRGWGERDGVRPAAVSWSGHAMGGGIAGVVDGHRVVVGSPRFVAAQVAGAIDGTGTISQVDGYTQVMVAVDGEMVGSAAIGDLVRPDVAASVATLRALGWRVALLSGDNVPAVRAAGVAAGIAADDCHGGASPEEKLVVVTEALRHGPVVMVGDGINDAAAIAAATVGVGVHGGAEVCLSVADVYLTTPGLASLVALTEGAERTMRVIRRNIAFSVVYNSVGAGLAMAGWLNPLIAALLMPASSLTVVIASWRSKTFTRVS